MEYFTVALMKFRVDNYKLIERYFTLHNFSFFLPITFIQDEICNPNFVFLKKTNFPIVWKSQFRLP